MFYENNSWLDVLNTAVRAEYLLDIANTCVTILNWEYYVIQCDKPYELEI